MTADRLIYGGKASHRRAEDRRLPTTRFRVSHQQNFPHFRAYNLNKSKCAFTKFAAWLYQRFPTTRRNFFQKKKFEFSVIGKMSRRQNTRVIQNQQITFSQEFLQVSKTPVFNFLPVAMQHHHA